jgi:hypothetical protein
VTSEIHRVFSYLGPDHVAEGFYTFDGVTLQMVYANGEPFLLDDMPVTETVSPEMVEAVAKKLTKRIRKLASGSSVPGFGRGESIGARPAYPSDGFNRLIVYRSESVV